MVLIKFF